MAAETEDDRLGMLATPDFGETAEVGPAGGPRSPVTGIFDDEHVLVDVGNRQASDSTPLFTSTAGTLADVAAGWEMRVRGLEYVVADVMPDGSGLVTLHLIRKPT